MSYQPQIVIIGAGIVGLATAYALLEQKMHDVLVLEQAVVNHTRAASASISRLLRFEYEGDLLYPRMVKRSLELWHELERYTQKTLYTPTGLLNLGNEENGVARDQIIARGLGLASERLSTVGCRQRFPQFDTRDCELLTYNPEGGILHASTCLHTLKRAILDLGGRISEGCRVTQLIHENRGRPIRLRLATGEEMTAERVVIAAGPWVHRLLGELRIPVELTRQYLLYFAGLMPTSFGLGVFPAFIKQDLYGFPIHKGSHGWLKAASHCFGRLTEPDAAISIEERVIAQTMKDLRDLLPALRTAELAHVETCIYDVSPDEDFILDALPDDPRIVFATGLSGHGFKFGPLLGRLLSSMVRETPPEVPLGRFRLTRFSRQHNQATISVA